MSVESFPFWAVLFGICEQFAAQPGLAEKKVIMALGGEGESDHMLRLSFHQAETSQD